MKRANIFLSTMHVSTRNVRILAAGVIAAGMIAASFLLTNPATKHVSALSTNEILRVYVEQDTDQDGLPDWQEQVYETDPENPNSIEAGMTDAEAVQQGLVSPAFLSEKPAPEPIGDESFSVPAPATGSLTERFSVELFETLMAAGGELSDSQQEAFLATFIERYAEEASRSFRSSFTRADVRITTNEDVLVYAGEIEAVLVAFQAAPGAENPAELAEALLINEDETAREKLKSLADMYESRADVLRDIEVPRDFADAHTQIVRAHYTLSLITHAIATFDEDPVATLGAPGLYVPTAETLMQAYATIARAVLEVEEGEDGGPGSILVELARRAQQI